MTTSSTGAVETRPIIRPAVMSDLLYMASIETASYVSSERYNAEELKVALVSNSYRVLVAETDERVVGFAILVIEGESVHFLDLAVTPAFREQGIGTHLVLASLDVSGNVEGATRAFAEIRASNHVSINGLVQQGFSIECVLTGYYCDPPEDALVMVRKLP